MFLYILRFCSTKRVLINMLSPYIVKCSSLSQLYFFQIIYFILFFFFFNREKQISSPWMKIFRSCKRNKKWSKSKNFEISQGSRLYFNISSRTFFLFLQRKCSFFRCIYIFTHYSSSIYICSFVFEFENRKN